MMKFNRFLTFFLILMMTACSRSPVPDYYVLAPVPCISSKHKQPSASIKIGLENLKMPGYLNKSTLMLHKGRNDVKVFQNHIWVDTLKENITHVLRTNLSVMIPRASLESSPWNSQFKPDYQLQVIISAFKVDTQGLSVLRADYFIYHNNHLLKKRKVCLSNRLTIVDPKHIADSMNQNLTQFSRKIAELFNQTLSDV